MENKHIYTYDLVKVVLGLEKTGDADLYVAIPENLTDMLSEIQNKKIEKHLDGIMTILSTIANELVSNAVTDIIAKSGQPTEEIMNKIIETIDLKEKGTGEEENE